MFGKVARFDGGIGWCEPEERRWSGGRVLAVFNESSMNENFGKIMQEVVRGCIHTCTKSLTGVLRAVLCVWLCLILLIN